MVTKEQIVELESTMIKDKDLAAQSIAGLKERQPDLFEWLTHHFNTPKSRNAFARRSFILSNLA